MKRLRSALSMLAFAASAFFAASAANDSSKTYSVTLYVTPPEGAEYQYVASDFFSGYDWVLNGQSVRPYWSLIISDPSNPDFPEWGMPVSYGENSFAFGSSDRATLILSDENFPIVINRPPAQDDYGYITGETAPGGILANGRFIPFGDNNQVVLSEPASYTLVGYEYDLQPSTLKFTTDCPVTYSIAGGERKPLNPGTTVQDQAFPSSQIRIYPQDGVSLSSVIVTNKKTGDRYSFSNKTDYFSYNLWDYDSPSFSTAYEISVQSERMSVTLTSNVADAVRYSWLDIDGATFHGDGLFKLPKADFIRLKTSTSYIITEVTDANTGRKLDFDQQSYIVSGITDGMTLNVTLASVVRDKTILFGFYSTPAMDGKVNIVMAAGTARQYKTSFSTSGSQIYQLVVAEQDLPFAVEGATFTFNGETYQSTAFLNNVEVPFNTQTGNYDWPAEIPSGSMVRFVNAVSPNYVKSRPVTFNIEEGVSLIFKLDTRNVTIANGDRLSLPVGTFINVEKDTECPYGVAASCTARNFEPQELSAKQGFRIESAYKDVTINVAKANTRNLIVYVDESTDDALPASAITLAPGKAAEKNIALTKGYQTITLATEDFPARLTANDGSSLAVFFNNLPLECNDGLCARPDSFPENSVLKIYAPAGNASVATAEVDYNIASISADYQITITHDGAATPIDPSAHHALLPGTEIRFAIAPKELEPHSAPFKIMAAAAATTFVVKVNGEVIEPDSDGTYLVKVNDDHIARGLNIAVEPLNPAALNDIIAAPAAADAANAPLPAIYNLNGTLILPAGASPTQLRTLPPGLYITPTHKLLIK